MQFRDFKMFHLTNQFEAIKYFFIFSQIVIPDDGEITSTSTSFLASPLQRLSDLARGHSEAGIQDTQTSTTAGKI